MNNAGVVEATREEILAELNKERQLNISTFVAQMQKIGDQINVAQAAYMIMVIPRNCDNGYCITNADLAVNFAGVKAIFRDSMEKGFAACEKKFEQLALEQVLNDKAFQDAIKNTPPPSDNVGQGPVPTPEPAIELELVKSTETETK